MLVTFSIVTVALQTGEDRAIIQAKEVAKASLNDPSSAIFRNVVFKKESEDGTFTRGYVCGYVNGKNSFGAMVGERRFVARAVFGKNVLDVADLQIEPGPDLNGNAAMQAFDKVYWVPSCEVSPRGNA
ncbi:hypothetical protein KIF53_15510 [Chromobacterium subtsugae]|uniref:Uncharacterized protein n=1 Tax=Chromobacterium subtsugae TaxID=251747 RepID=A0ABS7FG47_9NEIS|nr:MULTISPECIES: hypothetical protein [Chromobacterium]KUM02751.1 hypothetical protein Cv017_01480 [Chromobacterium subtsugae]KZE84968.1 hypothetical protein AWB61_03030 [Chromobacterium sp. F49]MBW7567813.1 hypothetical protein [Chromobacterium subtsugae]MBW8289040.1 hypothetical protein [Chromobacterium subtsugae]WSE93816.1 hypothetical protein U6115_11390 [Chromobacterium subtsugae]